MRGVLLSATVLLAISAVACLAVPDPILSSSPEAGAPGAGGDSGGDGGRSAVGTGGSGPGAGGSAVIGTGGDGSGGSSAGSGGNSPGAGGGSATGSGGSSAGSGGRPAGSGGASGTGGSVAGSGGRIAGTGGAPAGSGGAVGTGGADLKAMASLINGLRLDDACGTLQSGNACLHVTNNDALPYSGSKAARMGGTTGTTYQVTLHIRGVVEPTHIMGATAGVPANFVTGGQRYADGTNEANYEQWRITTSAPNQRYFVNAFNSAALVHQCRVIDFQVTIPIGGGAMVTIDIYDGNGHLISNTANTPPLAAPGVPGSMNSGQFIHLAVDNVTM